MVIQQEMRAAADPMSRSELAPSPPRRNARLIDIETPELALEAKHRPHNAGLNSQPHLICGSTRLPNTSPSESNDTAGASSNLRRYLV